MKEIFNSVLNTFENEDIRKFAVDRLNNASDYFFSVPASSSGKYHPKISLGEGGLVRHTVAVVRFLNHMLAVESIGNQFSSRERDLLRVAAICHDMCKSGTQADYEKNNHTKFDHPLMEANDIRNSKLLPPDEIELIAHCIESHMGQWNTDKRNPGIVLPKPQDKYQIIVHLADYLASRKDIEMSFENLPETKKGQDHDINTWILPFGKHKGKTLIQVYKEDPSYVTWARDKATTEPLHTYAVQLLQGSGS